jgi:hypothetical protein
MQRIVLAFLTAPLIAAGLITLSDFVDGAEFIPLQAYLASTYIAAIFPGLLLIYVMHKLEMTKPWQFGLAGFLAAVMGVGFMLGKIPVVQVELLTWLRFVGWFWEILAAGFVAGIYFGAVSYIKPNKPKQPDALKRASV